MNVTPMPVSRRSTSFLCMTDESLYLRRVWCAGSVFLVLTVLFSKDTARSINYPYLKVS